MIARSILLLAACVPAGDAALEETGTLAEDLPADAHLEFRYVVFADPHVYDPDGENLDRLDRAVAWVNAEAAARDLELVLVVGDIAWGDGLPAARASLEALTVPWVPLNGDNEVALGSEEAYAETFADRYAALASTMPAWEMGPVGTWNPDYDRTSWFHNVAFTWEGVRFVGLDWASRSDNTLLSEFGELHDYPGGTWPFFTAQLGALEGAASESVALFGHIPMHLGTFDLDQMARIVGVTAPVGDRVWADLAGHYHASASETVPDAGYDLHVTDAIWDDSIELRIVDVWRSEAGDIPRTSLVVVASE